MSEIVENSSPIMPGLEPTGSMPLAKPKWEAYAKERALSSSRLVAYRSAGFKSCSDHDAGANGARLERNEAMRDRIAWLCRQEEDVLRAKRQRIEEFKWSVRNADIGSYYAMVERPVVDKEGRPILDDDGNQRMRMVQELKPFSDMTAEQRSIIQSLKYTDSGRPNLELYPKTWAIVELKKMLGIGAQTRDDGDEFSQMSRDELRAFIARELSAIGGFMTVGGA